jgi:hypothetical protein
LPSLHDWLVAHHSNAPDQSYVDYFGAASLDDYDIRATRLGRYHTEPLPALTGGTYCISATALQGTFLPIVGHWTAAREAEYQILAREFSHGVPASPKGAVQQIVTHYADLREARLRSFLRHRQPDEEIAYSILVYRLTDEDIQRALLGPPAELE